LANPSLPEGSDWLYEIKCRWLKPVLVDEFEFLEWTADDHLRQSIFVRTGRQGANERSKMREDENALSLTATHFISSTGCRRWIYNPAYPV
jgi:hypothetical protein